MSEYFNCSSIDSVFKQIEEFARQQMEEKEKTLAEIIKNYDFIVGSKECKCKLMEVLPEGANIICSPYFEDPTIIYMIKKFDVSDLIDSSCEALEQESMRDATPEELKSVNNYIKSIGKPTEVKFDFDEEQEQIDFVQPHRTVKKLKTKESEA